MFKLEEQKVRRKAWIKVSNIPDHRLGWELKDCEHVSYDVINILKSWLSAVGDGAVIRSPGSKLCGKGILLYGKPGHGKTTMALSTIQEAMLTLSLEDFKVKDGRVLVRPCYYAKYNTVLALKGSIIGNAASESDEVLYSGLLGECKDDAYNVRILVLDDMGEEHSSLSGWQKNLFHEIIRTRFDNGLPTIVTTNIPRESWGKYYGDATESFSYEAFVYLPVDEIDLRK